METQELIEEIKKLKGELSDEWKKKKKKNGGDRDEEKIGSIQGKINELKTQLPYRKSSNDQDEESSK